MEIKWNAIGVLLLVLCAGFQLPAQQGEADRKLLADIRTKAEKGDAQSQFELGDAFQFGSIGVAKDLEASVKWFHKAAEKNVAYAQYNLGVHYNNGQGVAKDHVEAVKWYRKAAELNCAEAQFNLSRCYRDGLARLFHRPA